MMKDFLVGSPELKTLKKSADSFVGVLPAFWQ